MRGMSKFIVHHIPVCPFSQRVEILLALKGRRGDVEFSVVDITRPRDESLLRKVFAGFLVLIAVQIFFKK